MAQPYVGEIRMIGFSFAPVGWELCSGQLLPIAENETLFQLLGTTFGGDGEETFGIPNLQGRVPVHAGQGSGTSMYTLGESGGAESVTLTVTQIPAHTHQLLGSTASATEETPTSNVTGTTLSNIYGQLPPLQAMNAGVVQPDGGSQPHDNMLPYLAINYIISLYGLYPQPS